MPPDPEKLGRLGTALNPKDVVESARCLLASGDFRGVLLADMGLGPGGGEAVGPASGVTIFFSRFAPFAARAGVA